MVQEIGKNVLIPHAPETYKYGSVTAVGDIVYGRYTQRADALA